jgi:hypothetical protein
MGGIINKGINEGIGKVPPPNWSYVGGQRRRKIGKK